MSALNKTRPQASIVTLILVSMMLSACGYKAPVYYPTQAQRQKIAEREARIEARKAAAKQAAAEKKAAEKTSKEATQASQAVPQASAPFNK